MSSCRLYLISPPLIANLDRFTEDLARALGAGDVACMQLRLKSPEGISAEDDAVMRAAEALLPIARAREVAFVINDRPDLARRAGADGVHVGRSDASVAQARETLGEDAIIGATCHDSRHLGLEAGEAGADYVAFGAFYPTKTKDASTRAEPELLRWWAHATTVPAVAIGGVTSGNAGPLVRAGADFLAVSSAVWDDPDGPGAGVAAMNAAIEQALE